MVYWFRDNGIETSVPKWNPKTKAYDLTESKLVTPSLSVAVEHVSKHTAVAADSLRKWCTPADYEDNSKKALNDIHTALFKDGAGRRPFWVKLEDDLHAQLKLRREGALRVSSRWLLKAAKIIAIALNANNFRGTRAWLTGFARG